MEERDYYKILLVGASGCGKTYSFRNMNPETTAFINVENKPLPFKAKFKNHVRPVTSNDCKMALKQFSDLKEVTTVVFDSFSAYVDLLLYEIRQTKKGFEIWSAYNDELGRFFNFLKTIKKEVILTAHYEWLTNENGLTERRVKSKGKEWEGVIEKEFTMVMYCDKKLDKENNPMYYFSTFSENSSAKCPPDMFDTRQISNDSQLLINKVLEYVK